MSYTGSNVCDFLVFVPFGQQEHLSEAPRTAWGTCKGKLEHYLVSNLKLWFIKHSPVTETASIQRLTLRSNLPGFGKVPLPKIFKRSWDYKLMRIYSTCFKWAYSQQTSQLRICTESWTWRSTPLILQVKVRNLLRHWEGTHLHSLRKQAFSKFVVDTDREQIEKLLWDVSRSLC